MIASGTEPIEVSLVTPPIVRWFLGAFGAAIAMVATFELWRAVWPISIVTPFFGLILAVALMVSGKLVIGSIFGPDETWRIEPGRLTIRQSLRGFSGTQQYRSTDIASIKIETTDWDSRPNGYCLAVHLVAGKRLKSPELGTEQKAAAAMAMLTA